MVYHRHAVRRNMLLRARNVVGLRGSILHEVDESDIGSSLRKGSVCRQYVAYLFKWIKQHLRIKRFFGTSPNAVKTQIWIAVSVYVLVAIIRKRLDLGISLYTMLQIFSVMPFEKIPLQQALTINPRSSEQINVDIQLNLFEF